MRSMKRHSGNGIGKSMATNTNRKDGLRYETELCQKLAECGWWAHDLTQSAAGQPADILAVRCNTAVLIDCKVCSSDKFLLSRVEPNQVTAMGLWRDQGNGYCYLRSSILPGRSICAITMITFFSKGKTPLASRNGMPNRYTAHLNNGSIIWRT